MSHYYSVVDGSPQYTVLDAKGKARDTTLRDARKLNLVPSVTTIIGTLAKPGLDKWKAEQTIFAAMTQDRQKEGEEWEEYVKRIMYASQTISRKASDRGSELHNSLEKFFLGENLHGITVQEMDFLNPVINAVDSLGFNNTTWTPERSFAHPLGFGGKVDLSHPDGVILDFKTKNTDDVKKFYAYDEHLMQVSAYRLGLRLDNARCFDLYFSTVTPGIIKLHEWTAEDLERGTKMFLDLVSYWKLANKFEVPHE